MEKSRKLKIQQIEIERKYILVKPEIKALQSAENFTQSEIVQIYLASDEGVTHRVRSGSAEGRVLYTETIKRRIDKMSCDEREREISEEEFAFLSKKIAEGTRPIIKKRYTFEFCGQIFEIDVYPEWDKTAIMETELESREQTVGMPEFITIVREVTGDKAYSNASMSRIFPKEEF